MSPDAVLRTWGLHWRARLEGCPKERLGVDREVMELVEGDALAHIEAMKALHPKLTYQEALEAVKYGRSPSGHPLSYDLPNMAELERLVSTACLRVGEALWERYWSENGRYPDFRGAPSCQWQGRLMARVGVRYLVRQVYVCGDGLRGRWRGSSFDWLYTYAQAEPKKRGSGREVTLSLVKGEIDSELWGAKREPETQKVEKIYGT